MRVTFDIETKDPYIGLGLGSGWVYSQVPGNQYRFLGCAMSIDGAPAEYFTQEDEALEILDKADIWVAHNAQCDFGWAYSRGLQIRDRKLYCTKILGQLHDNSTREYSLDEMARRYLGEEKTDQELYEAFLDYGLYPKPSTWEGLSAQEILRDKRSWTQVKNFTYSNLDLLQEVDLDLMARYACQDTLLGERLFQKIFPEIPENLLWFSEDLLPACIESRYTGIAVDLRALREASSTLSRREEKLLSEAQEIASPYVQDFNPRSPQQKNEVFTGLGHPSPIETPAGGRSYGKEFLDDCPHELAKILLEHSKIDKLRTAFVDKILEIQQHTTGRPHQELDRGRIYPEIQILQCSSGRASSRGPNIQQIPKPKDGDELSRIVRSAFLPEEGERWYSLDFSNQEGRLVLHFANLIGADGAKDMVRKYRENPNLDQHQAVADKAGVDRFRAKVVNLAVMYGLGISGLAKQLELSEEETRDFLEDFHREVPYLSVLQDLAKKRLRETGSIKTILGRSLCAAYFHEKKDALNKLIQGSAADQTWKAWAECYRAGIPVLFPVHDELNFSAKKENEFLIQIAGHIMETVVRLEVPSVADVGEGENWGDAS